ncbi:phosphotransferase [Paenibacillus sp. SI8]|uniref:phosphotransferase n=1 Tax=unclassified Paenibacillus TaxID=185978 RepID=UPI003466D052
MAEIREQVIYEILQYHYGITPQNITLIRRKVDRQVWKITDTTGRLYAFKYLEKRERAPIIAAVNVYLYGKGVPVTTVLSTLAGASFVNVDSGCFLLFQWLAGEHPSYTEPGMIEKMAILLAQFHEASQGYQTAGNPITSARLDWNHIYRKKINKLEKCRDKANVSGDAFSAHFLNHLPWLQARAQWVLDRLPQTALGTLLDTTRQDPRLAHGDYSHLNLLRSPESKLTVIDLDTVSIALPMRDISHLITFINHALGAWSKERFRVILNAYQQVRPLSPEEYELLLFDQIFPHKAIRVANKYFDAPGNSSSLLHEFERCMAIDKEKLADLGRANL